EGELSADEYNMMKSHASIGYQILSEIKDSPYLSIAAKYHHERFDGSGYPEGLKGKDIPEFVRIISVADAYDTMSSDRRYRRHMPQEKIRDEFIRCSGTQFDPEFAAIMLDLIDHDTDYTMQEH
ncbi:MAG: HD domain-containing protein, partial [Clostridia bacterium]|nr:HD domain-containing protein [Clostridia bacterium]